MNTHHLTDSVPSWLGTATGAVLAVTAADLPLVAVVLVVTVSLVFGMMAKRPEADANIYAQRKAVFHAGALWLLAFALGVEFATNITTLAIIALGVGLAGQKVLDVVEKGVLRITSALLRAIGSEK